MSARRLFASKSSANEIAPPIVVVAAEKQRTRGENPSLAPLAGECVRPSLGVSASLRCGNATSLVHAEFVEGGLIAMGDSGGRAISS